MEGGERKKRLPSTKDPFQDRSTQELSYQRQQRLASHRKHCCTRPMDQILRTNFQMKTDASIFQNNQINGCEPADLPVLRKKFEREKMRGNSLLGGKIALIIREPLSPEMATPRQISA